MILVFFFLTLGAFYWEFRAFIIRSSIWLTVTIAVVLISVLYNNVYAEELLEIPPLTGILIVVFVIASQRRRAEEALRDANQNLENRVAERTTALSRLNDELAAEIIEHKRTEANLREHEAELRKLSRAVEQSPSIVIITNTSGIIEYVNPRFSRTTGYTLKEVAGKNPRLLKSGETSRAEYKTLWLTISGGGEWQGEFHNRKKNGDLYWVSASISPIRDSQGTITHFVAVQEDITRRKQVELQLEHSNRELQALLRQEQTMRDQLVQAEKLTAMGRMVASVAHELNNPLQTVKNCLYLVRKEIAPEETPLHDLLNISSSEIERLFKLVAQLREVYRPRANETKSPLELTELLNDIHLLITPHLQKHRVHWEQTSNSQPVTVSGIADQLKQVFLNISLNAIEAMQPDGGALCVELATADSGRVGVIFRNTGPSIPADDLPKLFDPFFTTKKLGTGLGLSISYDIVRAHRGQITVESSPGAGTAFTVWLPLLADANNADSNKATVGNR
ncbi:MAG: PAS domain S-box protein [Anaerolineae bacterium]